jgi:hypothetical protein
MQPQLTIAERVAEGIEMIMKYDLDAKVAAEHDVLTFGSEDTWKRMTAEERQKMKKLGWYLDLDSLNFRP